GSTYSGGLGLVAPIFPYPAFELLAKDTSVFSSVFAFRPAGRLHVGIKESAEIAETEYVSGDYFRGVAVTPAAGRLLIPDDDRAGATRAAVVSFRFAQRHFGSAEKAVDRPILINNHPFTIAGVTAPEFFGVDPAEAPDV